MFLYFDCSKLKILDTCTTGAGSAQFQKPRTGPIKPGFGPPSKKAQQQTRRGGSASAGTQHPDSPQGWYLVTQIEMMQFQIMETDDFWGVAFLLEKSSSTFLFYIFKAASS